MQNDYRHYSIVVKPVASLCNLRCTYCYYLDKAQKGSSGVMSQDVLEQYIKQVVAIHGSKAEIEFAWHGGEPTLAGIEFYHKALEFQKKYAPHRRILNTLQTNGTLINPEWCTFFAENNFRIGISIDGPEHLHNVYRKTISGEGTFSNVMHAIELFRKHGVEYNTLTTVNAVNAECGAEVYDFLRTLTDYMQFLPVVECLTDSQSIALPPGVYSPDITKPRNIALFSVSSEGYGKFLCDVADRWLKTDVGKKYVQIIEAGIGNILRRPAGLCVHESVCGHCAVVERNGDVYRCDRFVFDEYRIGNLLTASLHEMMQSNRQFGEHKLESLPSACLHCDVVDMCFGGCPKDRIVEQMTLYGIDRHNYLCKGYRAFFRHLKTIYHDNLNII